MSATTTRTSSGGARSRVSSRACGPTPPWASPPAPRSRRTGAAHPTPPPAVVRPPPPPPLPVRRRPLLLLRHPPDAGHLQRRGRFPFPGWRFPPRHSIREQEFRPAPPRLFLLAGQPVPQGGDE